MFFLTHFHITQPTSSPSAMGTRSQAGGLRRSGHSRGHRHRQAPLHGPACMARALKCNIGVHEKVTAMA
jgi:hypothetical protein